MTDHWEKTNPGPASRDPEELAAQFEAHRQRMRAAAYRMLGSLAEAEDAVQECWFRLRRVDPGAIENLGGWLTTVVARICLDMLRARKARGERPAGDWEPSAGLADDGAGAGGIAAAGPAAMPGSASVPFDPEEEALLAESVGHAMLVVLRALTPAERVAFVLHDVFDIPFEDIAPIVGRNAAAARQLASRARRRVRGAPQAPTAELGRQRELVNAFLAAARRGDFAALLATLDPDVVLRDDRETAAGGAARFLRGAKTVSGQIASSRARGAQPALVDGAPGIVVAPLGRLQFVIKVSFTGDRISGFEFVSDPERLSAAVVAVWE